MTQTTVFDIADKKKQEGMEASFRNADSVWKKAANERIRDLVNRGGTFTADDVLEFLDEQGIVTHENRALGAIMQAWARAGIIKSTGMQVKCRRKKRHAGWVMLWRVV